MKKIVALILIIIFGALIVFSIMYFPSHKPDFLSGSDDSSGGEVNTPTYTIEEIPVDENTQLPNLERDIMISSTFDANARIAFEEKINETRKRLQEDPSRTEDWYTLGVLYHSVNDYEASKEIWEFIIEVAPQNTVAYDNLGKLYHFSLPDFPKSEAYFKQSITVDPNNLTPYLELHSLYRYSYKTNSSEAADILRDAINRFPDNIDLYIMLGGYYRDSGNNAQARAVYLEGMDKARAAGDVDNMTRVGVELERL